VSRGIGSKAMPPSRAAVLGAVQGPAELLPVSSSAHLTLIPWLGDWDWDSQDAEMRKSFEVALHAGAAAALLVGQRRVLTAELRTFDRRKAAVLALSFLPPAAFGVAFERPIEQRLGGPLPTALGLLAGAAVMAIADRRPQRRDRKRARPADGLALGLAQATALVPGISRNGATLTVARWRGFSREHANLLSRTVALPVIVAAGALKGLRLWRRGLPPEQRAAFVAGTTASFGSTLASQTLIRVVERDSSLTPYAAYRAGLAALVLARLRWRRRRLRLDLTELPLGGYGTGPQAPPQAAPLPSPANDDPDMIQRAGGDGAGGDGTWERAG
jgi:undecaprenyl-diphosphatase